MNNLEIRNNLNNSPKLTNVNYINEKPNEPVDKNLTQEENTDAHSPLLGRGRKISNEDNTTLGKLTEPDATTNKPPIAGPEIDEFDGPEPDPSNTNGIDDGFLSPEEPEDKAPKPDDDSDVESVDSDVIRTVFNLSPRVDIPNINPGPGSPNPEQPSDKPPNYPGDRYPNNFPYAPGYGPGVINNPPMPNPYPQDGVLGIDGVITLPNGDRVPDVNVYQHKKTLASGMMDLALFSANANQLRYVLESRTDHPYYFSSIFLISMSLLLQVSIHNIVLSYRKHKCEN